MNHYSRNALPVSAGGFGRGAGPIWFDDLHCFGNETTIEDCQTQPLGTNDCSHREDVGVICTDSK